MKKVLAIITTAFTPVGGLTSVMMNYYRVLDKSKVHIDFCSTNVPSQSLLDEIQNYGSKYYRMPKRRNVVSYMLQLSRLCRGYDIVHIHANSATAVLELLSAKMGNVSCRIVHNHNSRTQHRLINALVKPIYLDLYTKAVACSEEAGAWLYGKGNFSVLRNAINVDRFRFNSVKRVQIRHEWNIKDEEFVIGHVGKYVEAKNHVFLIKLFGIYHTSHPQSKLMLVGDGELRADIEQAIQDNNVKDCVVLTGLRQDIPDLLQVFDVFVFPSIYEGMPLSVVEAQASGLPCLVSDAVTSLVNIGEDVTQLSLVKGADYWADYIDCINSRKTRIDRCKENYRLITEAGYNITNEADSLMKLYGI